MWHRRSLSGFPTPLILLPSSPTGGGLVTGHGASNRCHQKSRMEYPDHPMPHLVSSELESMLPLVGSAPPSAAWMGQVEEGGGCAPRVPTSWLRGRPPKACLAKDGAGNSLPSSPDRGGADSDGYSMVSKAQSTCHCRRKWQRECHCRRKWQREK